MDGAIADLRESIQSWFCSIAKNFFRNEEIRKIIFFRLTLEYWNKTVLLLLSTVDNRFLLKKKKYDMTNIFLFRYFYREQPIFTCKAHVFHIDPKTKRSWLPASSAAVNVSFFYDSSRALYRIISVEGTKVCTFLSFFLKKELELFKSVLQN